MVDDKKIEINNFSGKGVILYCGKKESSEPLDYIHLKDRESKEIELKKEWTRIVINGASESKGTSLCGMNTNIPDHDPGRFSQEESENIQNQIMIYTSKTIWNQEE